MPVSMRGGRDRVSIFQAWFANDSVRFRIRVLRARLRDQRAELTTIWRHLRPGDIACDIGANKGSFIYWLSRWVRVVAFEPQPELARGLSSICRAIGLANVTVEAKAVHLHAGEPILYVPTDHQPGASLMKGPMEAENLTTLTVPVVALDEYFNVGDRVTLLKSTLKAPNWVC